MLSDLWGLLYPKRCIVCDTILNFQSRGYMCETCAKTNLFVQSPMCKKCGKPIENKRTVYCFDCYKQSHHYEMGRALWPYAGAIKDAVHDLKYNDRPDKGRGFSYYLCYYYKTIYSLLVEEPIDIIIPVPLHAKRLKKRGYNQADLLCTYLEKELKIPVVKQLIIRKKYSGPLKALTNKERAEAVRNAFSYSKKAPFCAIMDKNILLVDDIYTTGTTVDEIARLLKEHGARKVYVLCISIGRGFS